MSSSGRDWKIGNIIAYRIGQLDCWLAGEEFVPC